MAILNECIINTEGQINLVDEINQLKSPALNSWTPSLLYTEVTYTNQKGTYTYLTDKILFVTCYINFQFITVPAENTEGAYITGFPFNMDVNNIIQLGLSPCIIYNCINNYQGNTITNYTGTTNRNYFVINTGSATQHTGGNTAFLAQQKPSDNRGLIVFSGIVLIE